MGMFHLNERNSFISELCWGKAMVAYTKHQQWKKEAKLTLPDAPLFIGELIIPEQSLNAQADEILYESSYVSYDRRKKKNPPLGDSNAEFLKQNQRDMEPISNMGDKDALGCVRQKSTRFKPRQPIHRNYKAIQTRQ